MMFSVMTVIMDADCVLKKFLIGFEERQKKKFVKKNVESEIEMEIEVKKVLVVCTVDIGRFESVFLMRID